MDNKSASQTYGKVPFWESYWGVLVLGWSMWVAFGVFIAVCAWVGSVWK